MALIVLLFIADSDLDRHALTATYQAVITMGVLLVFFVLLFGYRSKAIAFTVAVLLWVISLVVRERYIK